MQLDKKAEEQPQQNQEKSVKVFYRFQRQQNINILTGYTNLFQRFVVCSGPSYNHSQSGNNKHDDNIDGWEEDNDNDFYVDNRKWVQSSSS